MLDTDAGCGPVAQARLERFRLRTKVAVEALDWACLSVRGDGASTLDIPGGPAVVLQVEWPSWSGVDLLGPAPAGDPELATWLPDGAVLV